MTELFADSQLDQLKAWSAELNTALAGHHGWARSDGATFVSASRPSDYTCILRNSGGWWVTRWRTERGERLSSEPFATAEAAVVLANEPVKEPAS